MSKPDYEFNYVSTKQKARLILWKALVILFMLILLAMLIFSDEKDLGYKLLKTSGILQAVFCYINLMTVRVEVQELFEPPVHFKGAEFFWLAMIALVASFFV